MNNQKVAEQWKWHGCDHNGHALAWTRDCGLMRVARVERTDGRPESSAWFWATDAACGYCYTDAFGMNTADFILTEMGWVLE